MNISRKSAAPTYDIVVPSYPSSPPAPPIPTQTQYPSQVINQQIATNNDSSIFNRRFLSFLGGLFILTLLVASVAIPLIIASNSFANDISTTSITSTLSTASALNSFSNLSTTLISNNTSTSSTLSKLNTTLISNITLIPSTSTTPNTTSTSSSSTTASTTSTSSTSTTSSTTSTSSTSTTSSTTSTTTTAFSYRWNTTGVSVLGAVNYGGLAPNHLDGPIGIVFDVFDTLYVADANNNRIQKLLWGNTAATTVAGSSSGTSGSTASLLNSPTDVAVDSNGNIYVVDSNNNRVQLWNVNATAGVTIAGNGTAGNSTTLLNLPYSIAFDSKSNTFYISDGNNHRVLSYTLNSTVGTLVAGGNGPGISTTQLYNPRGLYFDSTTNSLFIANYEANNVVQWVIGASNWTLIAGNMNGVLGSGSMGLYFPWDVILDPMRNIYVDDHYNERIQFFLLGQNNGTTIAGVSGSTGGGSTEFKAPLSVALDSQLNLYVADSGNDRIQKFVRY